MSTLSKINWNIFYRYRNAFKNQEAVIMGNGPSLNTYKIIHNCIHIGCNRCIYLDKLICDFYFYNEWPRSTIKHKNDVLNYKAKIEKFFGAFPDKRDFGSNMEHAKAGRAALFDMDGPEFLGISKKTFEKDIDIYRVSDYGTSTVFVMMQFALFCGFKKIYIVGCDIENMIANNTADRYFYHNKDLPNPIYDHIRITKLYKKWIDMKNFAQEYYDNTQIISINPVKLKGLFEDIYQ